MHALDKAKYIHANYRFVVKPRSEYGPQSEDPDAHLDWDDVLQVLASEQSQSTSCPICLSTPVAPRITKCGHIFCLPCLIRYMYASDDAGHIPEKKTRYKKCPLCEDIIFIPEARPVRWVRGHGEDTLREGADVVLRLMMRYPRSTLALPRDTAEVMDRSQCLPWYFAAEVFDHARIMKGDQEYMFQQYDDEIAAVERQEMEDEVIYMDETARWSRKAVSMIQESKERAIMIGNAPQIPERPPTPMDRKAKRRAVFDASQGRTEDPESHGIDARSTGEQPPDFNMVQHASDRGLSESVLAPVAGRYLGSVGDEVKGDNRAAPLATRAVSKVIPHHTRPHDTPFYFYEAAAHFYLSPLDIRILKASFGDFSLFPPTILPRLEHVSGGHVIDDELKRRAKYLSHVPNGCEVGFIECDWTDIVAPEILARFAPEIERRRHSHKEKQAREDKEDRIRAGKTEDEKRWAAARRRQHVDALIPDAEFEPLPTVDEGLASSPPWPSRQGQGSAFASLASPSTSPVATKTVWGTVPVAPLSPALTAAPSPPADDGWLPAWDMSAHLQSTTLDDGVNGTSGGMGGKKRRNKKITLMSTNGFRGA